MRFKQESVKHRTRMADTDKGLPAMENVLVLLSLTVHQLVFSALTHFHPCCIKILAIFERAREVPGHEWAIPLLEGSLRAPTQAGLNRTGPTSSASLPARVSQICTIQQRIVGQISLLPEWLSASAIRPWETSQSNFGQRSTRSSPARSRNDVWALLPRLTFTLPES